MVTTSRDTYGAGNSVDLGESTNLGVVMLRDNVLLTVVVVLGGNALRSISGQLLNIADILLVNGMAFDLSIAWSGMTISLILRLDNYPRISHTGQLITNLDLLELDRDSNQVDTGLVGLVLNMLGGSGIARSGRRLRGVRSGRATRMGSNARADVGILHHGSDVAVLGRHGKA